MNGLLVRVGADKGKDGGRFNGVVDSRTGEFAYIPIPETKPTHPDLTRSYDSEAHALARFQVSLPANLLGKSMHLDPDFEHLTYGDQGQRAKQIETRLGEGDLIVFYAGLVDSRHAARELVYAIIGVFHIDSIRSARSVPKKDWGSNAHTRRLLREGSTDIVVRAKRETSGRLRTCLPIGTLRAPEGEPDRPRSYRVRPDLLAAWGGLSVKDGYIQRSARLPVFLDADRFYRWFMKHKPTLLLRNN